MEIKCFLFLDQFTAPIKTIVLDFPGGVRDKDIKSKADKEFKKGFRIEIEDVRNPLHPPYKKTSKKAREVEIISRQRIKVDGKIYKKSDILILHGMTGAQYNYLRCIRKFSMVEILNKGLALYVRKKESTH